MQPARRYSLAEIDPAGRQAHLAVEGRTGGILVEGVNLEAQFVTPSGGGLVFITEDSPYDEGLHVYLLAPDGSLEDALEAGSTFSAGILEITDVVAASIDLRFFRNDVVYRLEVSSRPQLRFTLPPGWRYKRRIARHRLGVRPLRRGRAP